MDGISYVLSSFYSSLFSSEDAIPSAQSFLLSNLENSLSSEQSGLYGSPEGPLTIFGFLFFIFYFSIFLLFHFTNFGFFFF